MRTLLESLLRQEDYTNPYYLFFIIRHDLFYSKENSLFWIRDLSGKCRWIDPMCYYSVPEMFKGVSEPPKEIKNNLPVFDIRKDLEEELEGD